MKRYDGHVGLTHISAGTTADGQISGAPFIAATGCSAAAGVLGQIASAAAFNGD